MANAAVRALSRQFLLRSEQRAGGAWVELVHDRFIQPVTESNDAWRRQHLSPLQHQAALWADQDRPPALLLDGEALAQAEKWAGEHEDELEPVEREFLDACTRRTRRGWCTRAAFVRH